MKTYLAALTVLALGACVGPSDAGWRFTGQVQNLTTAPAATPIIELENVASGAVAITGGVMTECWNDGVTLDGDRSGTTLTMTIERVAQTSCTDERTRHHLYLGIFSQLRSGEYTFRVINAMGDAPVVELETTLDVQ
ncbi:MAG TPA: hypothetical protein VFR81_15775 [Longimicrobium sp.]|nr:hypothetical protein [Longimicrobium sp.]